MTDSGKRFEAKFHKSLKLLPGLSMRIEDGGARAKNQQLGDFLYFDCEGRTFLFECKATKGAFELRNLRQNQLESLTAFRNLRPSNHSIIAINYYGEKESHCVLISITKYRRYLEETKKKSLNYQDALELGIECPRINGIWQLNMLWEVI